MKNTNKLKINKCLILCEINNKYEGEKMNKVYVISDTHFGHENIIKYCNRPFKSVNEMDSYMIQQWNKTVHNDDIVIHCGDFCFGNSEKIKDYANQLNGQKILILGNHDRKGKRFFLNSGFDEVYNKTFVFNNFIFSHAPLQDDQIPTDTLNLHGHIHNYPLNSKFNKDIHKCVSVECLIPAYIPIELIKYNLLLMKFSAESKRD